MDHTAGANLDKRNALPTESAQRLDSPHRPRAASPEFRGDMTGEGGHLFEQRKLADEELKMTKEWQDRAGEWQLLSLRQGESFSWNCFLPQRQLKILLVETDDSTRQILSALLRNCNYSVISVANGLQAWDILRRSANHVDMVLTEVVMPGLSGIGLLCRITSHTPCKNVPVIMMSSSDSMGLVVKCLSNGAADFLLKPVRKNELSNLWQHVWRRNHSVHGNGNQTESHDLRASELKSRTGSSELNLADGSDDGSRTQSSWTKPVRGEECPGKKRKTNCSYTPHVDSPKKNMSTRSADEVSDINQATSSFVPASAAHRYEKEMLVGVGSRDAFDKTRSLVVDEGEDEEDPAGTQDLSDRELKQSIDFFGILGCQQRSKKEADSNNSNLKIQTGKTFFDAVIEKPASDSTFLPTLELSLKQQRAAGEIEGQENRVLKRSISSAFSRYTNHTNSSQPLLNKSSPKCHAAVFSDNRSLVTESSRNSTMHTMFTVHAEKNGDVVKPGSLYPFVSHRSKNQGFGLLPTVANRDDYANPMSNTNSTSSAVGSVRQPIRTSTNLYEETTFHCNSLHPPFYTHSVAPQKPLPCSLVDRERTCETGALHDPMQSCDTCPQKYCHSHYRTLYQQHQNLPQKSRVVSQPDEQTVANARCGSSQCGPSFTVDVTEGNSNCRNNGSGSECNRSGSGNESVTGSNNASNYVHEKINALSDMQPTQGVFVNGMIEYGRTGIDTGDGGLMKINGSLMTSESEQNPLLWREAALSKFRQKRKERCFHKKIRYLSRKVLAEQRPRVRGQFVRQPVCVPAISKPELCVGTVF